MTRLNTQFSVKGISLLNSVMASSSSVQFKKFLFNQVDDIAGNEVSPTKQAMVLIKSTETSELVPNSSYLLSLGKTACSWMPPRISFMHPLRIWAHDHKCAFMASFCSAMEKSKHVNKHVSMWIFMSDWTVKLNFDTKHSSWCKKA